MAQEWVYGDPLDEIPEDELKRRKQALFVRTFAPGGLADGHNPAEAARVNEERRRIARELDRWRAARPTEGASLSAIGTTWVERGVSYWAARICISTACGALAVAFGGLAGKLLYDAFRPGTHASLGWQIYLSISAPIAVAIGVIIGWATYGEGFWRGRYGGTGRGTLAGSGGPDPVWAMAATVAFLPTLPLSLGAVMIGVFCAVSGRYWPVEKEAREKYEKDEERHQKYLKGQL
jgi:hypothetical protein